MNTASTKRIKPSKSKVTQLHPKNVNTPSIYQSYIQSLAVSGRSGLNSLLNRCASILSPNTSAQSYSWHTLNYAQVAMLKAELVDMGYAVSSINLALSGLKGIAQTAFNMRQMDSEELSRIKGIKRLSGDGVRKGRSLNKKEIKRLLAVIKQQSMVIKRKRDKAMLLTLIGAGLRASELLLLDIGDYDMETGKITVKQGKGRKYREVYLAKKASTALRVWINARPIKNGFLFTKISRAGNPSVTPLTKAGLTAILESIRKESDVPKFSPHDLRRTFITQLLEQGIDINTVRQLAGHSDISTTARYDCRGDRTKILASRSFSCW